MQELLRYFLPLVLGALAAGCGTDSGSSGEAPALVDSDGLQTDVSITQSGSLVSNTRVSLGVTDAPIDNLVVVMLRFTAVEFRARSGGWIRYRLDTPRSIDLLELQGGNTADLLTKVPIAAGDYREIRLFTSRDPADNYVKDRSGGILPLQIPGGSSSGIKLKTDFVIPASRTASYVIDFDLRQSVRLPGNLGRYRLGPVIRLASVSDAGGIRGEVDPALLGKAPPVCSDTQADTFNAAYIFQGHDVTPDDIDPLGNGTGPLVTAPIFYDSGKYVYEVAFLPAGKYTVAITCNADRDDLEADDDLRFFGVRNATVVENNIVFL